jgi:superfamily II DNA/RNA helicase
MPSSRTSRPQSGGRRPVRRRSSGSSRPAVDPATSALEQALTEAMNAPAPQVTSFAELGLPVPLVDALDRAGIRTPFPIQARTMPDVLARRDVLGRAQTGSGKTLAFGLPMLARLAGGKRRPTAPRGLVLVPTRELAKQVADAITPLGRDLNVRVTTVFGGAPMGRQIADLQRGVDIVVATPGRLIDLMERRSITLDAVETVVLDEADYMADLGFLPAVTQILDATPAGGQRLLFSATLDRGVDRLVRTYLTDPAMHAAAPAVSPVDSADHRVFTVGSEHKVAVAAEVAARPGRTLFFVRTKHGADRLAQQLSRGGVPAAPIHGNLTQGARQLALDSFTAGSPRVLVATDVAARGIHVDDVDLVVHFDPPNDHKDYLHRSGRTARAGSSGTVVSLVQRAQMRDMARLHEMAKVSPTISLVHPGHDDVREIATSGTPVVVQPMPARRDDDKARFRRGGYASGGSSRNGGPSRNGASSRNGGPGEGSRQGQGRTAPGRSSRRPA